MSGINLVMLGTSPSGGTNFIGTFNFTGKNCFGSGIKSDSLGNIYLAGTGNVGAQDGMELAKYNSVGVLQWQKILLNASYGTSGSSVAVDSSGNIFVAGDSSPNAYTDMQLAKYNSSGVLQWQKLLGNTGTGVNEAAASVATDSSGNVYVSGYAVISPFGNEAIIAKYNTSGTLQWQRQLGGTGSGVERARGIAVDSSSNVYTVGTTTSTTGGLARFIITKHNTSGAIQWQRFLGGTGGQEGYSIAVDSSANVYVCGYSDTSGTKDCLVAKYNTSGTLQWQRTLGGAGIEYAYGIAVDSSANVYICGQYNSADCLLAKYNTSGTIQWQRRLASSAPNEQANAISISPLGDILVAGYYNPSGYYMILASLPSDGSKTGTYTVGSSSFTYDATTMTDAASSQTSSTGTLSDNPASLTDATSALSSSDSTLTSTVSYI